MEFKSIGNLTKLQTEILHVLDCSYWNCKHFLRG